MKHNSYIYNELDGKRKIDLIDLKDAMRKIIRLSFITS